MSNGEAHACRPARIQHLARVRGIERERLLAKDMLAGVGGGNDLKPMQ
jgi:hypothetical protein